MRRRRALLTLALLAVTGSPGCEFPDRERLYSRCEIPLEDLVCPSADLGGLVHDDVDLDVQTLGCELWVRGAMEGSDIDEARLLPSSAWKWRVADPDAEPPEPRVCEGRDESIGIEPSVAASYSEAVLVCPSRTYSCPGIDRTAPRATCRLEGEEPLVLGHGAAVGDVVTYGDDRVAVVWYAGRRWDLEPRISYLDVEDDGTLDLHHVAGDDGAQRPCADSGSSGGGLGILQPAQRGSGSSSHVLAAELCGVGSIVYANEDSSVVIPVPGQALPAERVLGVTEHRASLDDEEVQEYLVLWTNGAEVLTAATTGSPLSGGRDLESTTLWNPDDSDRETPEVLCFAGSRPSRCMLLWTVPSTGPERFSLESERPFAGEYGDIQWQALGPGMSIRDAGNLAPGQRPTIAGVFDGGDDRPGRGVAVWRDEVFGVTAAAWSIAPEAGVETVRGFGQALIQLGPGSADVDTAGWSVSEPAVVRMSRGDLFVVAWWARDLGDPDEPRATELEFRVVQYSDDGPSVEVLRSAVSGEVGAGGDVHEPPLLTWLPAEGEEPARILVAWNDVDSGIDQSIQTLSYRLRQGGPEEPDWVFENPVSDTLDGLELRFHQSRTSPSAVAAVRDGFVLATTVGGTVTTFLLDRNGRERSRQIAFDPEEQMMSAFDVTLWVGTPPDPWSPYSVYVVYAATDEFWGDIVPDDPGEGEGEGGGYGDASSAGAAGWLGALSFDLSEGVLGVPQYEEDLIGTRDDVGVVPLHPRLDEGPAPTLTWTSLESSSGDGGEAEPSFSSTVRIGTVLFGVDGEMDPPPETPPTGSTLFVDERRIPAASLSDLGPESLVADQVPCPDVEPFLDNENCLLVEYGSLAPDEPMESIEWLRFSGEPVGGLALGTVGATPEWFLPGRERFEGMWLLPGGMLSAEESTLAAFTTIDQHSLTADRIEVYRYLWGTATLDPEPLDTAWLAGVGRTDQAGLRAMSLHLASEPARRSDSGGALWVRFDDSADVTGSDEYVPGDRDDDHSPDTGYADFEATTELLFTLVGDEFHPSARAVEVDEWAGYFDAGGEIWIPLGPEALSADGRFIDFVGPHYNAAVTLLEPGRYLVAWRRDDWSEAVEASSDPMALGYSFLFPVLARVVDCRPDVTSPEP